MYSHLTEKMHDFDKLVEQREVFGISWTWPKSDVDAFNSIANDYAFYILDILKEVKGNSVVVQAGGNCGMYPKLLSSHFDTVYTFEPDPLNFHCLVHNCQDNNIIKFNCCVGDFNGLVNLNSGNKLNVGCHIIDSSTPTINTIRGVPTITIDQLRLYRCDLIFLDVELFEYQVLMGAKNTIRLYRPIIFLESHLPEINEKIDSFLYLALGYKLIKNYGKDRLYRPA